jgi:hypothetical protein
MTITVLLKKTAGSIFVLSSDARELDEGIALN